MEHFYSLPWDVLGTRAEPELHTSPPAGHGAAGIMGQLVMEGMECGRRVRGTLLPPSFSLKDLQPCRFKGTVKKVDVIHRLSFFISEHRSVKSGEGEGLRKICSLLSECFQEFSITIIYLI